MVLHDPVALLSLVQQPWHRQAMLFAAVMQAKSSYNSRVKLARRLFEQALDADPYHRPSLNGLGQLEERAGNHAKAAKLWHRGLAISPNNTQLLFNIAQQQESLGQPEVS